MAFERTPEEELIVQAVRELAASPRGRAHWRACALRNEFPHELWGALADAGYLGLLVPEEHGGAGLGLQEMATLMETMASEGMALLLMIVSTTMSTIALARHGSPEQRARFLPGLARGTTRFCFAITEPNAGSNTFRIARHARRRRLPHPRSEVLHLRRRAGAALPPRHAHRSGARHDRQAGGHVALRTDPASPPALALGRGHGAAGGLVATRPRPAAAPGLPTAQAGRTSPRGNA